MSGAEPAYRAADLIEFTAALFGHAGLVVEWIVESKDGSVSLRAERFWPLPDLVETPSHDFR